MRRAPFLLLIAFALGGCTVAEVETPDPRVIPSGSPVAQGAEPTGDLVALGQGQMLDLGWRYVFYPSDDGLCTQLETMVVTSTTCGDPLPKDGETFGGVSFGEVEPTGVKTVDGFVTSETETVLVIAEGAGRAPAVLMSGEPAGIDARAFVLFMPADVTVTHLQAVARNGDVLDTYEVP